MKTRLEVFLEEAAASDFPLVELVGSGDINLPEWARISVVDEGCIKIWDEDTGSANLNFSVGGRRETDRGETK